MYKKLTAVVVAGLLGTTLATAQETTECPKGKQDGKCGMRGGKGPMNGKHRDGDKGRIMKHMFSKLNLTDEQQAEMETLKEAMKETAESRHDELKELMEAQKEMHKADLFDETAFRANYKQMSQIKEDMAVEHALLKKEMMSILTDDQKTQLETAMAEMKERFSEHKGAHPQRRGHHGPQGQE